MDISNTHTIIDDTGKSIALPVKISRIADSWPAHSEILCMLGAGNKIIATSEHAKTPWMLKINPQIKNAINVFGQTDANAEELIKNNPDVVFMPINMKNAAQLNNIKLPVVQINVKNFDDLKKCIQLTASILGPKATQRADMYDNYLDTKIAMIKSRTTNISIGKRPRVVHISSLKPLRIDGKNNLISAWIEMAGGINAADINNPTHVANGGTTSMEQLITWNPDIIIIGKTALNNYSIDDIKNNSSWQSLRAVRNNAVFVNPAGVFFWDRYGVEEALQIQWAAKIFYPDKFSDIDIKKETFEFYHNFFSYDLSNADITHILKGEKPTI